MDHVELSKSLNLTNLTYTENMARYYESMALASELRLEHATTKGTAYQHRQDIAMYRALATDYWEDAIKLGADRWEPLEQ